MSLILTESGFKCESKSESKQYLVIFEDNGMDCFTGTYEECEKYIQEVQVNKYGRSADEFGIYEDREEPDVIDEAKSASNVIYAISNTQEPDIYEDSFWAWDTEEDTGYKLTTIEDAIESRDTFKTIKKATERAIDILDSIEDEEVFVVELDNYSPYNPTGVFKKLPEDASIQIEEDVEQYYVYLDSPAGTELIGRGDKETCERIKAEKDKQWRKGYMWSTRIESKPEKETNYWD